jgi:hypothetical protein
VLRKQPKLFGRLCFVIKDHSGEAVAARASWLLIHVALMVETIAGLKAIETAMSMGISVAIDGIFAMQIVSWP